MKNTDPNTKNDIQTNSPSIDQHSKASNPLNKWQLVSICAGGLILCFFLPWINFIGSSSGFDLTKLGGKAVLLWSIPLLSTFTIVGALTKNNPGIVAQLTGVLPFIALGYGVHYIGSDIMRIIGLGGYLSLILGLALFILPFRRK